MGRAHARSSPGLKLSVAELLVVEVFSPLPPHRISDLKSQILHPSSFPVPPSGFRFPPSSFLPLAMGIGPEEMQKAE